MMTESTRNKVVAFYEAYKSDKKNGFEKELPTYSNLHKARFYSMKCRTCLQYGFDARGYAMSAIKFLDATIMKGKFEERKGVYPVYPESFISFEILTRCNASIAIGEKVDFHLFREAYCAHQKGYEELKQKKQYSKLSIMGLDLLYLAVIVEDYITAVSIIQKKIKELKIKKNAILCEDYWIYYYFTFEQALSEMMQDGKLSHQTVLLYRDFLSKVSEPINPLLGISWDVEYREAFVYLYYKDQTPSSVDLLTVKQSLVYGEITKPYTHDEIVMWIDLT